MGKGIIRPHLHRLVGIQCQPPIHVLARPPLGFVEGHAQLGTLRHPERIPLRCRCYLASLFVQFPGPQQFAVEVDLLAQGKRPLFRRCGKKVVLVQVLGFQVSDLQAERLPFNGGVLVVARQGLHEVASKWRCAERTGAITAPQAKVRATTSGQLPVRCPATRAQPLGLSVLLQERGKGGRPEVCGQCALDGGVFEREHFAISRANFERMDDLAKGQVAAGPNRAQAVPAGFKGTQTLVIKAGHVRQIAIGTGGENEGNDGFAADCSADGGLLGRSGHTRGPCAREQQEPGQVQRGSFTDGARVPRMNPSHPCLRHATTGKTIRWITANTLAYALAVRCNGSQ